MKYSTLAVYNQDTYLEALNSKVEYRKSLFLFAIVVCELILSLFAIMSSIEGIVYYFTNHYINLDHHLLDYHLNITNTDPIKDQLNIPTPVSNHSELQQYDCSTYPIPLNGNIITIHYIELYLCVSLFS